MQEQISSNILIRIAQEQDLEQILNIETKTAVDPWTREIFFGCINLYHSFVAVQLVESDYIVLGYGIIAIYPTISEAHILNLAIDPLWQRKKVGSRLLRYLIDFCNKTCAVDKENKIDKKDKVIDQINNNKIFLEVNKHNLAAINLYKKFNFIEVGIRKNYYNAKDGKLDALVLLLEF